MCIILILDCNLILSLVVNKYSYIHNYLDNYYLATYVPKMFLYKDLLLNQAITNYCQAMKLNYIF